MSDKDKKRLLWAGAVVAVLVILWLLLRGQGVAGSGGQLGPMAGPGGLNVGGIQVPGLPGLTIPAPWTPPPRNCNCGCKGQSGGSPWAMMGYPAGIYTAQNGVI